MCTIIDLPDSQIAALRDSAPQGSRAELIRQAVAQYVGLQMREPTSRPRGNSPRARAGGRGGWWCRRLCGEWSDDD